MSSKMNHTPGPWEITGISQNTGNISVGAKAQRIIIADVTNAASFGDFLAGAMKRGGGGFQQSDAATQFANAHLIAAAPDMLAALKAVRSHRPDYADTVWDEVDEVIAKATGGAAVGLGGIG